MSTKEQAHTAGPWDYFVGNANGRGLIRIETSHLAPVAGIHIASLVRGPESEANAARIVLAVNCHDELVAALTEMVMAAEGVGLDAKARRKAALTQGMAAIARATGSAK